MFIQVTGEAGFSVMPRARMLGLVTHEVEIDVRERCIKVIFEYQSAGS